MFEVSHAIENLLKDENGAVAVEYVVISAALTLALVPGFYYVSSAIQAKFQFILEFVQGT